MRTLINFINMVYNSAISAGCILLSRLELQQIIKHVGKKQNCTYINDWCAKWSVLGKVNKDFYRVFSKFFKHL